MKVIKYEKIKKKDKKPTNKDMKNSFIERNIITKIKNKIFILILNTIMIILLPTSLSKKIYIRNLNSELEITLTINGTGTQYILSDESIDIDGKICQFSSLPTQILINDVINEATGKIVNNLINDENNITLKWDYEITDCCAMFYGLSNIIKITFTKFNS